MANMQEDLRLVQKLSLMSPVDRVQWNLVKNRRGSKAEYVWIDDGGVLRNKTLILPTEWNKSIADLPVEHHTAKSFVRPIAIFDGISGNGTDVLVLCLLETINSKEPHSRWEKRNKYRDIMQSEKVIKADIRFEIEQEFLVKEYININYFSHGQVRRITEAFYEACCNASIPIRSIKYKCALGECWSYTIGPLNGLQAADMLWMSRFILKRIAQDFDLTLWYDQLIIPAHGRRRVEELKPMVKYRLSDEHIHGISREELEKLQDPDVDFVVIYGSKDTKPIDTGKHQCFQEFIAPGPSDSYDVLGSVMESANILNSEVGS